MKRKTVFTTLVVLVAAVLRGLFAGDFTTVDFLDGKGDVIDIYSAYKFPQQNKLILLGNDNFLIQIDLERLENKITQIDQSKVDFNDVNCVAELTPSEILLGTDRGVFLLSLIANQVKPFDKTLPPRRVNHLLNFNDYIVIVYDKSVVVYKNRLWKTLNLKSFKYLQDFIKVIPGRSGILWLVGEKGVVPLNEEITIIKPLNKRMRDAVVDNNGLVYALTNKAIYHFDGQKWIKLTENQNNFKRLGVDNSNTLILFNDREFGVLSGTKIKKIPMPEVLNNEPCLNIFNNGVDKTYFISQNHLAFKMNFPKNIFKTLPKFIKNQYLFFIADDTEQTEALVKNIDRYWAYLDNSVQIEWLDILLERTANIGKEIIPMQIIQNRILRLNSQTEKERLLRKLILAAQVVSPELSVGFQMKMIKMQTSPEKIIKNKLQLAKLYAVYGGEAISNAIYQEIYQKFSPNIKGVDWAIYKTLEMNGHGNAENLEKKLLENSTDPIVRLKARYYNYKSYMKKLLEKQYKATLTNFNKIDLNNATTWKVFNGHEQCYLTNEKRQVFVCNPQNIEPKLIDNKTSVLKVVSSVLGDLALTSKNEIVELTAETIQKLNMNLRPQGAIKNLFLSKNAPLFNTKNQVYYYSLQSEQWRSFRIPAELRSFNFLQICSQNEEEWLFVTESKVFIYNNKNKQVKSVPLPISVIKITDALMDIGGFLYIGTNSGLYLFHEGKWLRQDESKGFLGRRILNIEYQPQEDIIIVQADSTYYIRKNNLWFDIQENKYIDNKIDNMAADTQGYLYLLIQNQLWMWSAREGKGPLMLLTAVNAAERLMADNRLKELANFLDLLTSNSFTGEWAYEYRGRILLKLNDFRGAYDNFQYGINLFKERHWFSDTSFVALVYDLLQKDAWEMARQTTDLFLSVYPQSALKEYLFNILIDKCETGPFTEHLKNRIETIFWLRSLNPSYVHSKSITSLLNFLLIRNYYQSTATGGAVAFLKQALSENDSQELKLLWQYLILQSAERNGAVESFDLPAAVFQLPNNFIKKNIGGYKTQIYFKNLLKFK
ncbi:hypothetical protein [Caldithrix abyssi]